MERRFVGFGLLTTGYDRIDFLLSQTKVLDSSLGGTHEHWDMGYP